MKKLTVEQAEMLKEKIKNLYLNKYPDNVVHNFALDMKEIISECTEKDFPEYIGGAYDETITIFGRSHAITIFNDTTKEAIEFRSDEFKSFTNACNKIVEWIDEVENE